MQFSGNISFDNAPLHDHEPDDLVFGPVNSRRFGRSFGISLSSPGHRSCHWQCPYCQLGHWPEDALGLWAETNELKVALDQADPADADVICCSGSGENLDHPEFLKCFAHMQAFARRVHRPLIILTNGDALKDEDIRDAIEVSGARCYVKWDCGPRDGAWRSMDDASRKSRSDLYRDMSQIRLQSMFVTMKGQEHKLEAAAQRWLDEVTAIRPVEIHMTTLDRPSQDDRFQAVPLSELSYWADLVKRRLSIPVSIFKGED